MVLTLEGRVAGPWAAELERVWLEQAPQLATRKVVINLANVIYADGDGIRVLREVFSQAQPEIVANSPWTKHLAEQIAASPHDRSDEEQENADDE